MTLRLLLFFFLAYTTLQLPLRLEHSSTFVFRIFPKILYDITGTALHGTGFHLVFLLKIIQYFNIQGARS